MAKKEDELNEHEKLLAEAKALGVTRSKIDTTSFTVRGKTPAPEVVAAETANQEKLADKRLKARIEQKKLDAKKKPIEKREELLKSRFRAVTSESRAHTYSDKNLKAWLEEYNLIKDKPKMWEKLTNNGKIPFVPDNRKRKTTKEILEAMKLD